TSPAPRGVRHASSALAKNVIHRSDAHRVRCGPERSCPADRGTTADQPDAQRHPKHRRRRQDTACRNHHADRYCPLPRGRRFNHMVRQRQRDANSRRVWLNGVDITSSFTYQTTSFIGCGAAALSTGTIHLRLGQQSDTLRGAIADMALNPGSEDVTYTYVYSPPTPAPHYAVSVTPDSTQAIVAASTGTNVQFVVHNTGTNVGGQLVTDSLSVACTGTALPSGCTLGSNLVTLAADSAVVSTVTFTPGAAGTSGRIRLLAKQRGQPTVADSGWFN